MSDYELHHGDMLEVMPTLAKGSVAMVFADLPYGQLELTWDIKVCLRSLRTHIASVTTQTAVTIYTATHPFAVDVINSRRKDFRYDLIWSKARCTNFMLAKKRPMRSHESILIFGTSKSVYNPQKTKGKPFGPCSRGPSSVHQLRGRPKTIRAPNAEGMINPRTVLNVNETDTYSTKTRKKLHPTQKPVALLEWLIATYTNPGDTVLDPCFGSGTTGVACANLSRKFIGIEKDTGYFATGKARIEKAFADAAAGPRQTSLAV